MPIKSGIGFGEAQVYNQPGAIVNLYGKLLQQQAKDQAQFATDLNNIMSKYSTKGLKDEDIKSTANAYQQIKDKVTSSSTRTPAERAQALADARNGMQTIQEYSDAFNQAQALMGAGQQNTAGALGSLGQLGLMQSIYGDKTQYFNKNRNKTSAVTAAATPVTTPAATPVITPSYNMPSMPGFMQGKFAGYGGPLGFGGGYYNPRQNPNP